jgi:hypothetical protein
MDRRLTSAAAASSSWVSRAARRSLRSVLANVTGGSATGRPLAGAQEDSPLSGAGAATTGACTSREENRRPVLVRRVARLWSGRPVRGRRRRPRLPRSAGRCPVPAASRPPPRWCGPPPAHTGPGQPASASSSCVRPAPARSWRSSPANQTGGSPTAHLLPPVGYQQNSPQSQTTSVKSRSGLSVPAVRPARPPTL